VKRRGFDPVLDGPVHRPREHRLVVAIHAEDEAAVNHDAEIVQAADRGGVVAAQVLILVLLGQVLRVERLEADEQAAQAGFERAFEQIGREHRVDRAGRLPEPAHATHALEQGLRKAAIAEQMVVEKVQMPTGQALDLRQRRIDRLGVEGLASKNASL